MGIPFTHVYSRGSILGWKAQGIPLLELITPERFRSSTHGLAARQHADNISGSFAGLTVLSARTVVQSGNRGRCRATCRVAGPVTAKCRSRPEPYYKTHANRCERGFSPCGLSP